VYSTSPEKVAPPSLPPDPSDDNAHSLPYKLCAELD